MAEEGLEAEVLGFCEDSVWYGKPKFIHSLSAAFLAAFVPCGILIFFHSLLLNAGQAQVNRTATSLAHHNGYT